MNEAPKQCFKCKKWQDLDDFYKHPQMKDGHLGKCKQCTKDDVTENRTANLERIRAYDRERGKLPHRIVAQVARTKIFRKMNPMAYAAHIIVGNAVRSGKLKKPRKCSECNRKGMICGHHEDYYKPLDVIWVCQVCHKKRHKCVV